MPEGRGLTTFSLHDFLTLLTLDRSDHCTLLTAFFLRA